MLRNSKFTEGQSLKKIISLAICLVYRLIKFIYLTLFSFEATQFWNRFMMIMSN